MNRSDLVGVEASVLEPRRTLYLAEVADLHVLYVPGIDDGHVRTDISRRGRDAGDIPSDEFAKPADEFRTMAIESHDVCGLRREPVEYDHLAPAGLVENRSFDAVPERGRAVRQDDVDILDERVMTYIIIGDIVLDILYAAVVAHGDIVQGRVIEARVLLHPSGEHKLLAEGADADFPGKPHGTHMVSRETRPDFYPGPIIRGTRLRLQRRDFTFRKFSVFHKPLVV